MKLKRKHFDSIVFSEYTQTYRSVPQNYWLASVRDGQLVFDSWDGAIRNFNYKNDVKKLHKERTKL